MNVEDYAEQLLLGPKLEDKLLQADVELGHVSKQGFVTPDLPGRSANMALNVQSQQRFLPKLNIEVSSEKERGALLHMFANHELLAIELMALALLKFPDAPKTFKKHLLQTIRDEQTHTQLYIDRMNALGIELGDVPMSGAFWNQLSTMDNPKEYIACMSLTLEQANLDFAWSFEQKFRACGDAETATLLSKVLQDELFHVRVGVQWMNTWKAEDQTQWDFYCQHLRLPLSPVKAKAMVFNRDLRRQVGLNDHYIESLEHFQRSRGRPPDVWVFNALGERDWWTGGPAPKLRTAMDIDLEAVLHLKVKPDDMFWARRHWSREFCSHLQVTGRTLPELRHRDEGLGHRHIGVLQPWMITPAWLSSMKKVRDVETRPLDLNVAAVPQWKKLNSKSFQRQLEAHCSQEMRIEPPQFSIIEKGTWKVEQAERELLELEAKWGSDLMLKSPLGASGDGLMRWRKGDPIPKTWMHRMLQAQGSLVVEPFQCRRADYSTLGTMTSKGIEWLGRTRMLINSRGQYLGALMGADFEGLSAMERKACLGGPDPMMRRHPQALEKSLIESFQQVDFKGPFGVDTYLYGKDDHLKLRSLCELNCRMTFGHIALSCKRLCSNGHVGLMLLCPLKALKQKTFSTDRPPYKRGVWALNDLWSAEQVAVILVMEATVQDLRDVLPSVVSETFAESCWASLTPENHQL